MNKSKLKIIPIAEFDAISSDSMLYVLGGKSDNTPKKCGTFSCHQFECSIFSCGTYSNSRKKKSNT